MAWMFMLPLALATFLVPSRPVQWTVEASALGTDTVVVRIIAALEEGWHIYATELPRDDGPLPTVFRFSPAGTHMGPVGSQEPEPVEEVDPNFAMVVRHHSGNPEFNWYFIRSTTDSFRIAGEVEYMMCNDRTCLPPATHSFEVLVPAPSMK